MASVSVRQDKIDLPTYLPQPADPNPMFLEKRVYQGSSGRVYPLPFVDRIAETKTDMEWDAIHLENEWLYVMILPAIGGRIHILRDKTNGYDAIYNQPVIKPALVGLAGPWISGGIEFNWPQHHRPSTFMPAEVHIERGDDGSVTVWLSEHDPMQRMKGMHGVCLHPDRAVLELKARAYNRTTQVQTFLWWANVATRVHEGYQSFFPPDASYVADHAKRAMSAYPLCQDHYYGVDYGERGRHGVPPEQTPVQYVPPHCLSQGDEADLPNYAPNDLSWYANIPVPTSYMCMGTREDFVGGYDHKARAGLLHLADHRIAPGKKQWTWGNHEFGYAWDRNLTDADENGEHAPYIELMAGVFTDNQPDFSFLQPGETKAWSQFWYPLRETGVVRHANVDAALGLHAEGGRTRVAISVTRRFPRARIKVTDANRNVLLERTRDLAPDRPFVEAFPYDGPLPEVETRDRHGEVVLHHVSTETLPGPVPPAATEPPSPEAIAGTDELYLTGLHLEQYRHATRCPTLYWREALRRDPDDSRCNNALGLWHLNRGEWAEAEAHFRRAIARQTMRNPNPRDGEPYYNLGLCLRYLQREEEAYDAFHKAAWNEAWQAAGYHALAEIDATRDDWNRTLDHLDRSLRTNVENLRARCLKVIALRRLGRDTEAGELLAANRRLDPLDAWSRLLADSAATLPAQTRLDVAHDCLHAGLDEDALIILQAAQPEPGCEPLVHYTLALVHERLGQHAPARTARKRARKASPRYCFPARLEEIEVLGSAIAADPSDARAPYYLGNLLYDRRRHHEAIARWRQAVKLEPGNAVAWRNLGIGYFNILSQPRQARIAYDKALRANPRDARLLYERDQLWKRLGVAPEKRLRKLERHLHLVRRRDDLCVELCALYNQTDRAADALSIITKRHFQPWEGGEGLALGQHVRTHLNLGRAALRAGDAARALTLFRKTLDAPRNLGEAKHLLANQSDIHYVLGCAAELAGDAATARDAWTRAARFKGDFQEMSVRLFSEMTYYSALALRKLGRRATADKLLRDLLAYARKLKEAPARIDYFATSLPTLLLFEEDLQTRQEITSQFLEAQALQGLGERKRAARRLDAILQRDPCHAAAHDLLQDL